MVRTKTVLHGTAASADVTWDAAHGPGRPIRSHEHEAIPAELEIGPSFPTERFSDESFVDRGPNDMLPSFGSLTTHGSYENRSPRNGGLGRRHLGPGARPGRADPWPRARSRHDRDGEHGVGEDEHPLEVEAVLNSHQTRSSPAIASDASRPADGIM